MATIGLSKVFILDKYFTELQKFWETERKVQGINSERFVYSNPYLNTVTFELSTGPRNQRPA